VVFIREMKTTIARKSSGSSVHEGNTSHNYKKQPVEAAFIPL
jgi:hypothetical protein